MRLPAIRRASTRRAGAGSPGPDRPRATRLTTRAAILGLAVCALVLALAYPLREYLAQRSQIAHLRAQRHGQQQRVSALEEQVRKWRDPAYVKAQARSRLQYVMPGEIGYVVLDPRTGRGHRSSRRPLTVDPQGSADASWYGRLWGTVRAADAAGGPSVPR